MSGWKANTTASYSGGREFECRYQDRLHNTFRNFREIFKENVMIMP
jgi:hypothetical protein